MGQYHKHEVKNDILDEIRKCVEEESLSFIVGSGFSRNISKKFPLWDDLLEPLVNELYPGCSVKEKISEKTYLGVASEYVRRKGYHESIDIYIERMIPYLRRREDGGFDLVANGEVVDSNPSTECHEKLLALGAKHIFTFNYDNTLDVLADVDTSQVLLQEQFNAENKAQELKQLREQYEREYDTLFTIERLDTTSVSRDSESKPALPDYSKINAIIRRFDLELQEYQASYDSNKLYHQHANLIQSKIDSLIATSQNARLRRLDQYHLITDAYQISLTDGCKNIYKLHGNLRTSPEERYEFDGDKHMQYVITQEDYDLYPSRHEAFVNLMRISLLKGNFCLIGFSGDDPNFIGWINWVKDILDYSVTRNTAVPRTIYYINAESNKLEPSKELLLRNHYIKPLNLCECYLSAQNTEERIAMFLNSLSRDNQKYVTYDESWGKLDVRRDAVDSINKFSTEVEQVYELSEYNRIPNQFGLAQYHRTNILSRLKNILESNVELSLRSKLIYSAIKGELIPVSAVLRSKQVNHLSKASRELNEAYHQLVTRSNVLDGVLFCDKTSDWSIYESTLSHLFNLRFGLAKALIEDWGPTGGIDRMRKFMLQSVYDDNIDPDAITSLINQEKFACVQDYRYAIDILSRIRGVYIQSEEGKMSVYADLQQQMDSLTKMHPDLVKCYKEIDSLIEQMNRSKSKPFGNTKEEFHFDSYDKQLVNSTKVLQILIELAIPTEAKNIIMLDKEKWRSVCERVFEYYPQPCLYYTLLYGNNIDLVRRISQQYIYSNNLRDVLPKLLRLMLDALVDYSCSFNIREAIYIAAPIFMKAVDSSEWLPYFERFFDRLDLENIDERRCRANNIYQLIITGIELTDNVEFKHKVLLKTLQIKEKINDVHNRIIIAASKGIQIQKQEHDLLLQLLHCATTSVHLFVLMNMSDSIGRETVAEKLSSLDDDMYTDCTLLEAACHYSQYNVAFHDRLKNIILGSHLLWQTGIEDNYSSVRHYGYTLDITGIQRYINFTDDEIKNIYDKLKLERIKIHTISQKWSKHKGYGIISDWCYVLIEMQNFLRINKPILRVEDDYAATLQSVTKLLNKEREGNKISLLLLDDNKTAKAITWLSYEIYNHGAQNLQHEYMLLVNKLLSHQSKYLNSCFKHFGWALAKYKDDFQKIIFKPLLEDLLSSYEAYFDRKKRVEVGSRICGKECG